jgi:hypothetical protein
MLFRRRRVLPPELEAFGAAFAECAAHVDLAQRAMLRCVPSSARSVALPLEVGAQTVRLALVDARAALPGWRTRAWLKRMKSDFSPESVQSSVSPGRSSPESVSTSSKNCAFREPPGT